MTDRRFFDDDILRREAALIKAAERSAHSQLVHDCRILSLSDDLFDCALFGRGHPATSDSLHRSGVLHRYVWRATSGSASDGDRANSTAVTGAAENMTAHVILPKVS